MFFAFAFIVGVFVVVAFCNLLAASRLFVCICVCVCVCVLCVPVRDVSCVLSKCACVCACVRPAVVVCGECGVMPCVVVVVLVFIETSVNCFSFCSLSRSLYVLCFAACACCCSTTVVRSCRQ